MLRLLDVGLEIGRGLGFVRSTSFVEVREGGREGGLGREGGKEGRRKGRRRDMQVCGERLFHRIM